MLKSRALRADAGGVPTTSADSTPLRLKPRLPGAAASAPDTGSAPESAAEAPPSPPPGVDPVTGGLVAPELQPPPVALAAEPAGTQAASASTLAELSPPPAPTEAVAPAPRARPRLNLEPKSVAAPAEAAVEAEAPKLRLRGQPVIPQRAEREGGAPAVSKSDPLQAAEAPASVVPPVLATAPYQPAPAPTGVGSAHAATQPPLVPPPVVLPAAGAPPAPSYVPAPVHIRPAAHVAENELTNGASRALPPGAKPSPAAGRLPSLVALGCFLALVGAGGWWLFLRPAEPAKARLGALVQRVETHVNRVQSGEDDTPLPPSSVPPPAPAASTASTSTATTPPPASGAPLPPTLDPNVAAQSHYGQILERAADRISVAGSVARDRREELAVINGDGAAPASSAAPAATTAPLVPAPGATDRVAAPTPNPVPAETGPRPTVPASAAFRALVDGLRISGVFQGNPPRALIAGRTLKPGDVLDPTLGVVFAGADTDRKRLVFRDRTGAELVKRY